MDSSHLYLVLLASVAIQRLQELRWSRRNVEDLVARGGREYGRGHYREMVAMHAAFLPACALEVMVLDRPFDRLVGIVATVVFLAAMALRFWTLKTLGRRWSTRVIVVPGAQLVTTGPFRWLRHPNYLAVALEMLTIPLIHGAWLTATVFSALNAAVLWVRIRTEERALAKAGS